jgi:ATP-dependent protease ClpP protease subunit
MVASHHGGAANGSSAEARIVAQNGQRMAVVRFSGPIGLPLGFRASEFIESLNRLGDYDVLYGILDSPGGSAIEAWLIHHFLVRGPARRHGSLVLIATECSGDAILIGLGFQQILMQPQSYIRFHPVELSRPASTRRVTNLIAGLIARRIGCQIDKVLGWMDKSKKLSAEECLRLSLCDAII